VRFTSEERKVELIEGEALFDVAKDSARPFIVEAGDARIRAVGTSFTVRQLRGDEVKVSVREGIVEVARRDASAVRVGSNEQLLTRTGARAAATPIANGEIERALAWRSGMISLDGVTLREAADEFARYSDTRIVIEDPEIARRTVTGLFSANNPVGFANAIATSMSLRTRVEPGAVHSSH
jgi:transmembrane sensor